MEIRHYWRIIRRRWLFAIVPMLIVLAIGLLTYSPPPEAQTFYNVGVRFIVGQSPLESEQFDDEDRLANWQTSEYTVAALADWIKGTTFSERVSEELALQGLDVPYNAIWKNGGGLATDYSRSMLTLSLNHGDEAELTAMIAAAIKVLQEQNAEALPQLGGESAEIVQLDQAIVNAVNPPITNQLDLPLRIAIALIIGLLLAFLAEYLDASLHTSEEIELLGLPVLGVIPKRKMRFFGRKL
jgi:capsular polysaccharide biosynthesis protein